MKYNSMIIYHESVFTKIKNFFKNIFNKKNMEVNEDISENLECNISKEEKTINFIDSLKDGITPNNVVDKMNFLEYIDGNREALSMLSVERLKKLRDYYAGIIEENNIKIEKLKKES